MQRLFVANKAVIVNSEGKVLILRESDDEIRAKTGKWGLPGGRMEFGERPIDALKREIKEETALDIEPMYPVYVDQWQPKVKADEDWQIVGIFYACKFVGGEIIINEEFDEFRWVTESEIEDLPMMMEDKEAIIRFKSLQ